MNNKMEKYLEEARQARLTEPLMNEVEINTLLENGSSNTSINLKSSRLIRRFIVGIFSVSILAVIFTLLSSNNTKNVLNKFDKIITESKSASINEKQDKIELKTSEIQNKFENNSGKSDIARSIKTNASLSEDIVSLEKDTVILYRDNNGSISGTAVPVKKKNKNRSTVVIKPSKQTVDVINPEKTWKDSTGKDIPGIIALELTHEELKNLGIYFTDTTCTFRTEEIDIIHPIPYRRIPEYRNSERIRDLVNANYDTTGKEFIVKETREINLVQKSIPEKLEIIRNAIRARTNPYSGGVSINSRYEKVTEWNLEENMLLDRKILRYTGWDTSDYSRITPAWYGYSYTGTYKSKSISVDKIPINNDHYLGDYFNEKIRNFPDMIPVRVHLADKTPIPDNFDYTLNFMIFWFFPTKEFVDALPDRYRETLRNELDIIDKINSGNMLVQDACKGFDEKESFFEICKLSSGALSDLSVYPNPSFNNDATCRFTLTSKRKITITIHDVSGKYIATIMKNETKAPDDYQVKLNLGNISKGIYLVAVSTDNGEQVVQRLILN